MKCPSQLSEVPGQVCGGSECVRRTQQGRPLGYFGSLSQGLGLGLQRLQKGGKGRPWALLGADVSAEWVSCGRVLRARGEQRIAAAHTQQVSLLPQVPSPAAVL